MNNTTIDSAGRILSVGDTVATPGKESFDFAYEYVLANKVGVVKRIDHFKNGDCVIIDLNDYGLGLQRLREFEVTKL